MFELLRITTTDNSQIFGVLVESTGDTITLSMPLLYKDNRFSLATPDLGVISVLHMRRNCIKSFRVVEDAETLRVYDEQVKRLREAFEFEK